jgi:hypothetical protein
MIRMRSVIVGIGIFGAAAVIALACSSPSSTATAQEVTPSEASFAPLGLVLIQACGTLDCHGQVGRNLRIYGNTGLRLSSANVPTSLTPTTADEISQDFGSVVGLEPEIMSEVAADKGVDPERLTFYRKARGLESHKGGTIVLPGDARDVCITSWLSGSIDEAQCTVALTYP